MDHLQHKQQKNERRGKTKLRTKKVAFTVLLVIVVFFLGAGVRYMMIGRNLADEGEWSEALFPSENHEYTNTMVAVVNPNNILEYVLILNKPNDSSLYNTLFIPGETYFTGAEGDSELYLESYQGKDDLEQLIHATESYLGLNVHEMIVLNLQLLERLAGEFNFEHDVSLTHYKEMIMEAEDSSAYEAIHFDLVNELSAFIETTRDHIRLFNAPRARGLVKDYMVTSLSWKELFELSSSYVEEKNIEVIQKVPGTTEKAEGYYYLLPDEEQLDMVVNQYFVGAVDNFSEKEITVEVLNGSGEAGIAREVADKLTEMDFQVVRIANADHYDYPSSQVIARAEPTEAARQVALEIPRADLLVDIEKGYEAMVTVIIGENYKE